MMPAQLQFRDVTLGYDRHPAVHHLSGEVLAGALLAVVGPNGAGKSTLFRGLVGILKPLAGTILTFILSMNAYATPVLLGGPRFQMMGPLVYNQFIQQNNWPFGGAIAFILMAVTLTLTVVANLIIQRRSRA